MTIGQWQPSIDEDELFGYLDAMPSDRVAFLPAKAPATARSRNLSSNGQCQRRHSTSRR